jgi:hypothetical protein
VALVVAVRLAAVGLDIIPVPQLVAHRVVAVLHVVERVELPVHVALVLNPRQPVVQVVLEERLDAVAEHGVLPAIADVKLPGGADGLVSSAQKAIRTEPPM